MLCTELVFPVQFTFVDHRKEKSLGLLTQNFVKLFLTMEVNRLIVLLNYLIKAACPLWLIAVFFFLLAQLETISLDEAARLLLGERHAESNMRSQYLHFFYFMGPVSQLS